MQDQRNPLLALLRHRNAKRYCAYTVGLSASAYLAYNLYKRDSFLGHVKKSLRKYTTAVDKGGDILQKLLSDLYEYVVEEDDGLNGPDGPDQAAGEGRRTRDETARASTSDRREVPESLRKVARLVESKEFRVATRSTVRAVVEGLVSVDDDDGEDVEGQDGEIRPRQRTSALDKVIEALVSERGSSLVSLALSMAAKNVVSTYVESTRRADGAGGHSGPRLDEQLFAFLSNPRGQDLAIRCISACADSAMLAYAQETKSVNYYDQMLDAVVKNKDHSNLVMDCISLSIQAAVSAWNASEDELEASTGIVEQSLVAELPDVDAGAPGVKGRACGADIDLNMNMNMSSPISALRPPLSSVGTPTSSVGTYPGTGRLSQASPALRRRRSGANNTHSTPKKAPRNEGFLRALSKEFIVVSKDEHGREAIAKVVGSVTKEAVGAMANTVADRFDAAYFLSVLLLGVLMSVVANYLMRVLFFS